MTRHSIVVSVHVTPEQYRELRRAALRDRRTLSEFSRLALHDASTATKRRRIDR